MKNTVPRKKARRSIRTMLMLWGFLFSIVPLCFVAGYSLNKYEEAVDNELVQRLKGNAREFITLVQDYDTYLETRAGRYRNDTSLVYYLSTNAVSQAKASAQQSLRNTYVTEMSLFNSEGLLIASLDPQGTAPDAAAGAGDIYLSDSYRETLVNKGQLKVATAAKDSLDLISMVRLNSKTGRTAGFVEEIIRLGPDFLAKSKARFGFEIMIFDPSGKLVAGSHPDFKLHDPNLFKNVATGEEAFFEIPIREDTYGFIVSPVKWGDTQFMVGLGASKKATNEIKKNINITFLSVIGFVIFCLVIGIWFAVRLAVRPLNELIDALQTMDQRDEAIEIPVKSDNEIGALTESFNEMARRTRAARNELNGKVRETEAAYSELKETQTRLVHSAKMASVGQLVAGVAHELNNPIGFIYSNMSHLRDYTSKLFSLIETAENRPAGLKAAKQEVDFSYIQTDLPRLIQSCEDGARRTRDIVLGLRNFSRLEEAKIKRVQVQEGIENTLRLLSGELKGRVTVHADLKPTPEIMCYASELNQVFMNILSNAAQAIDGEGEIWISTDHQPGSGRIEIKIRDSGKGIKPADLEKIFDPFFTTKTVGEGTGLGLSISYGIVQKHGGDIAVKSELGKGTEFTIVLPIEGPQANEQAKVKPPNKPTS